MVATINSASYQPVGPKAQLLGDVQKMWEKKQTFNPFKPALWCGSDLCFQRYFAFCMSSEPTVVTTEKKKSSDELQQTKAALKAACLWLFWGQSKLPE